MNRHICRSRPPAAPAAPSATAPPPAGAGAARCPAHPHSLRVPPQNASPRSPHSPDAMLPPAEADSANCIPLFLGPLARRGRCRIPAYSLPLQGGAEARRVGDSRRTSRIVSLSRSFRPAAARGDVSPVVSPAGVPLPSLLSMIGLDRKRNTLLVFSASRRRHARRPNCSTRCVRMHARMCTPTPASGRC